MAVTKSVMKEIGGEKIPGRLIMNKIDKLASHELEALHIEFPDGIFISAKKSGDVEFLRNKILEFFESDMTEVTILIPYTKGYLLGQLRGRARIINESYNETGTEVTLRTLPETVTWLKKNL